VCWNPSILDPQTLVVGCYYDPKKNNKNELVQIYAYIDSKKEYALVGSLNEEGHTNTVTDVEWAPQFGRSFHLIASCSMDKRIIFWKVDLKYEMNNEHFDNIGIKYCKLYEYEHNSEIWRISWNLSGTLLSAIDNVGKVSVFKKVEDKKFEKLELSENEN
jgi:nucleoporin SEH1